MKNEYLLHYVEPAAFDILCDRLDPGDPFRQIFESLTSILEKYYDSPPLEIAENFRFHQQRQESGESVQQFAAVLHKFVEATDLFAGSQVVVVSSS